MDGIMKLVRVIHHSFYPTNHIGIADVHMFERRTLGDLLKLSLTKFL